MVAGLITAVLLVLFIVGSMLMWHPALKPQLDAAARLPLEDLPPTQVSKEHMP